MNLRSVIHVLGALVFFVGLFMCFPIFFSLYYKDGDLYPLVLSLFITCGCGILFWGFTSLKGELRIRDSYAIVTLGWILSAAFGSLPFLLSGAIPSVTDAFFETMSGFTTTGATILTDIEAMPHGLLFWRSLTHWLGGMGIIVLSIAILPFLGLGGMQLYKAEIPGPIPDKLTPRIQQTAKQLWGVYFLVTLIETGLLMLGEMSLFDALCHTFGTVATGGFSTKSASIGHYNSTYIDIVIIVFMIIAGANFSLHYHALHGQGKMYWKNAEFRFYLSILGVFVVILTVDNFLMVYPNFLTSLRRSAFQVVSITTTTGFGTADFERWSSAAQFILLLLMFVGGSAGSTGGSIKILRVMIIIKHGFVELRKLMHPKAVIPLRIDGKAISPEVVASVMGFTILYLLIFIVCSIVMNILGLDLISAVASVAATLGNIGPGLGTVGPTDNYAHLHPLGKWLLSFCMLAGRLEIYTVMVFLSRDFWKR